MPETLKGSLKNLLCSRDRRRSVIQQFKYIRFQTKAQQRTLFLYGKIRKPLLDQQVYISAKTSTGSSWTCEIQSSLVIVRLI